MPNQKHQNSLRCFTLTYLQVPSVQSSSQMFPHFHQFGPGAPGTGSLFERVLLQVCLKLALPLQQLAEVICTHQRPHT